MTSTKSITEESAWIVENAFCWVKFPKASQTVDERGQSEPLFREGKIDKIKNPNNVAVVSIYDESKPSSSGSLEVEFSSLVPRDPSQLSIKFDDMVRMTTLNEAELLRNVRKRYEQNEIFTYIGPTLIVMNPYKSLEHRFSPSILLEFKQAVKSQEFNLEKYPPHIYAIAVAAFKNLLRNSKKQAIVISGESGAGKTENAKYAMKCLASISQDENESSEGIEDRILSCNPLLEAFGNAKTVRNDNSSRFGKYVKIIVRNQGGKQRIVGAEITKYLLEKSRVIHVANGERNYHIFYHLLLGSDINIQQKTQLLGKSIADFQYLNQSSCQVIPNVDDKIAFHEVLNSIKKMRFKEQLETSVFQVLSAILYLGNLEFDDTQFNENNPCVVKNQQVVQTICNLLGIESAQFTKALTHKTRTIPGQTILSPVTLQECVNNTNTLSKALYDRLFVMLVEKLNEGISPSMSTSSQEASFNSDIQNSIGLLDIFGFENFVVNSFEQLCINYTNEYLQQLYITYVFKNELKVFEQDGLSEYLGNLKYEDNQAILDSFDGNANSIFALLNESCLLKNNDDKKFLAKLKEKNKDNNRFVFPRMIEFVFTIAHTQSNVEYNVDSFREKNMDELSPSISASLASSNNTHIIDIFQGTLKTRNESISAKNALANNNANKYLCSKFKAQMGELMEELYTSDVHFVRCIKPNEIKRKDCFIEPYVMQQIRYLGVLESIEVRRHTYPIRKEFKAFFIHYRTCSDRLEFTKRTDYSQLCKELLIDSMGKLSEQQALFGKVKIYLKQEYALELDRVKHKAEIRKQTAAVLKIQRIYRKIRKQKAYKKLAKNLFNFTLEKMAYTQLHSFDKIKEAANEKVLIKFMNILNKLKKTTLIQSFYKILEQLILYREVEKSRLEQSVLESGREDVSDRSLIQGNNTQESFNSALLSDTSFVSQNSAYGTVQVEQNTEDIPANKLFYVSKAEQDDDSASKKLIDLQNYRSEMVKDWNRFSVDLTYLEGDTIYISQPEPNENKDSEYLRLLLDTKILEKSPDTPPTIAEDVKFQMTDIEETLFEDIKQLNLLNFYKSRLNKRTNMIGVRKSDKEIMTFQKKPLGKGSLIGLNPEEVTPAIQHFQFLIEYMGKTPTNAATTEKIKSDTSSEISDLTLFSLRKSVAFKNEIITQIIKQLNQNKKEALTIKLLQYLKVYLYCFSPDSDFLNILLRFLIFDLYEDQWKNNDNVQEFILYNVPTIIRKLDEENPRMSTYTSLLPQYETQALIHKEQIKIHVLFSTGSSVQVDVDAWDTFHLLKEKILRKMKINSERIREEYFQIFEMHFEERIVNERMLLPDTYVWDVLYQWNQKLIQKQYQSMSTSSLNNESSGVFSIFMIRVFFPFTLYSEDWAGISLVFSQVYFEIYVGKHLVEDNRTLSQLAALAKVIHDQSDINRSEITDSLPLTLDEEAKAAVVPLVNEEYNKIKGKFSLMEAKFVYLKIAKQSEYYLGFQVPISYITSESEDTQSLEYLLVLKPTYFFIITALSKKRILLYEYHEILKWGRNVEDSKNHLLIITNDQVKHLISSKQTEQIDFYLHEAKNLISQNRIKSPADIEDYLSYSRAQSMQVP